MKNINLDPKWHSIAKSREEDLVPNDGSNLGIASEMIEQSSENNNLSTRKAEGVNGIVSDHQNLPIEPLQVFGCRLSSCVLALLPAMVDPLVIKNLILVAPLALFPLAEGPDRLPCLFRRIKLRPCTRRRILRVAIMLLVVAQPPFERLDDILRDEPHADAFRVEGGQDLTAEPQLELLELRLAELALQGGGDEHEMAPLCVGNGLEVAVVDRDNGDSSDNDNDKNGARVLVPPGLSAEVLNLGGGDVVVRPSNDGGEGGRRREGFRRGQKRRGGSTG